MVTEIYTRSFKDKNCDPNKVEHTDQVERIIQEIKMVMSTNKGDVLGDYHLGCNIEDLVFKTKKDASELESIISEQIAEYVQAGPDYKISTEVKFGKGNDGCDIALVDIYINQQKATSILIS